jgi:hypothetical protein
MMVYASVCKQHVMKNGGRDSCQRYARLLCGYYQRDERDSIVSKKAVMVLATNASTKKCGM